MKDNTDYFISFHFISNIPTPKQGPKGDLFNGYENKC